MSANAPEISSAISLLAHVPVPSSLPADLEPVVKLQHATNYLSAAQIFLSDNVLLREPLAKDHVKPRLLGHWGTCPGINLVYAHLTHLIKKHHLHMFLVTGPGHGAPANLSNLYLEGTLKKFYPEYSLDNHGLKKLIKGFSWPGGFPSHVNSQVPGQIHEGGELGYALAVSFGAVMDNPDLIVTCIVGDGEAETGPTATAWHSYKYLDPKDSGAVLPILHLNGFKISEKTLFGCMDDSSLASLFSGYGYHPRVVGSNLDTIQQDMAVSLEWAYTEIRRIQTAARSGMPIWKPRWPMIILRSPKGWTGPKELRGQKIEGTFRAHQVPLPNAKTDDEEFTLLKQWLESYKPNDLWDENGFPNHDILSVFPHHRDLRMGQRKETYAAYKPLDLPDWKTFATEAEPDSKMSEMKAIGKFLKQVFTQNQKKFRMFSPDEMVSNKLDAVFEATDRVLQWDKDLLGTSGSVTEVLSEHDCQGWLQGYTLTGRVGLFPSYEAFLGIITTMAIQYAKFVKMGELTTWRTKHGSLNYIETSTLWHQHHNGFSHQNPGFLSSILQMSPQTVRAYFPPDANCALSTMHHCLKSTNYINLIIGSKADTPVWLTADEAEDHCRAGAGIFKFASTDDGFDPDVVLVGCGVEVTQEVIHAAAILRKDTPFLRVRVVNVTDLMILPKSGDHPHSLTDASFESLFSRDKPIVFNYHGYPNDVKKLLWGRSRVQERITILGYKEEGTTTTPFRMLTYNEASRFDVARHAVLSILEAHYQHRRFEEISPIAHNLITKYQHEVVSHNKYIEEHGDEPEWVEMGPKFDEKKSSFFQKLKSEVHI